MSNEVARKSRAPLVALVLLAVVAAVGVWLVAGGKLPFGTGGEREGAGGAGETARVDGTPEPEGTATTDPAKGGPRLFGRPREERVGTGTVVARVMDFGTGKPAAGAKALLAGTGFGMETVASRATTSPDGGLLFSDVPAGEAYSLRVEAEGHPALTGPAVGVEEGRTTDLGVLWVGRRSALTGIVVDVEGKPVADASIGLHPPMPGLAELMKDMVGLLGRLDQEEVPLQATKCDRAGQFTLDDVAPGPHTLLAKAPGFAMGAVKVSMTTAGAAEGEVRIVLRRGGVVAGRVVTTADAGVAGARIALMAESDPEAWIIGRNFVVTDANGGFRIDTMPTGDRFQAVVSAAGHPTTFAHVQPGREDNRIVVHDVLPITVRLLTKEGDEPVEGATVAVAIGDAVTENNEPDTLLFGTTDRAGRATIDGRVGHLQMAFVSHPDRPTAMWIKAMSQSIPGMLEGPATTEVTADTREVVFRVPTSLLVTGRVLAPDGTALPGARVSNFGFGVGGGQATADESGRYRIAIASMGGMGGAMLMVSARGYVQPQASMMVTGQADASGELQHDFKMERAAVVTGRVVDGDARPLAGALVTFRGGADDQMMGMASMLQPVTAYSAEDGSFLVDSARGAKGATLLVHRTGYVETTSAAFDVASGQSVRAPDLVMRRGATLVVRVVNPSGGPAKGGRVQVDLADAGMSGFDVMDMLKGDVDLPTDESGVARVPNLKAGKATVTASGTGFAPARTEVDVPAADGATREVEVRLRAAQPVTGRVTDEGGQPLRGASVRVESRSVGDDYVPAASATTDAEGKFRIDGLPEVPLTMSVRATGRVPKKVEVTSRREDLEVRLPPEDRDKAKRRTEVLGELTKIVGELQAAKDEAERKALQQRMQELSAELVALGSDGISDLQDVRRAPPDPQEPPKEPKVVR